MNKDRVRKVFKLKKLSSKDKFHQRNKQGIILEV